MDLLYSFSQNTLSTLIILAAALLITSLVLYGLRLKLSEQVRSELHLRVRSWWVILLLVSSALLIHRSVTFLFFAGVSFLALREFLSMIPVRSEDKRVLIWLYLAIPIQYYWAYKNHFQFFTLFIPLYLFIFLSLRLVKAEGQQVSFSICFF